MATDRSFDSARAASAVDIGVAISRLLASREWRTEDRSSRAILHTPALRVVLTALHEGASLHNDDPDEALTVQGIRGQAVVSIDGEGALLDEGTILAIPSAVPWRLVATADSVVLLTVSGN
jgi:quercetin dioxygenase-like cupin family protein